MKNTHPFYKEKVHITYLLTAIFLLIVTDIAFDIIEDLTMQELFFDILLEVTILTLVMITASYIWRKFKHEKIENADLKKDLIHTEQVAKAWEAKSKNFMGEFQMFIDSQFQNWSFSKSEKEVAILLLQGKTSKEIAAVRFTSERTIRNQCRAIYEKSSVAGRNEFFAFFLSQLTSELNVL